MCVVNDVTQALKQKRIFIKLASTRDCPGFTGYHVNWEMQTYGNPVPTLHSSTGYPAPRGSYEISSDIYEYDFFIMCQHLDSEIAIFQIINAWYYTLSATQTDLKALIWYVYWFHTATLLLRTNHTSLGVHPQFT